MVTRRTLTNTTLEENVIAIDTETTGLARDAKLLGISWADAAGSGAEEWMGTDEQRAKWQNIFDERTVVMHNAKFDLGVLERNGMEVENYHDTQVLAYCWNTTHDSYSLRNVAAREGTALKLDFTPEGGWDNAVWSPEMATYAEGDTIATYQLYQLFRERLMTDEKGLKHYLTIERPFIAVIREMESTGFTLDMVATRGLFDELTNKTAELLREMGTIAGCMPGAVVKYKNRVPNGCGEMVGVNIVAARTYCDLADKRLARVLKGELRLAKKLEKVERDVVYDHCKVEYFNPNSGRQIADALTRLYGWQPTEYTPTGVAKTDTESLQCVKETMPLAAALVQYAELNKVLSSFISPFLDMQEDGVLRANFNQTVTKTGRLSSSNPNLQNVPTRSELGKQVRKLVAAPAGYTIVGIDLSNIEGRVLAAYLGQKMGDMSMANTFNAGVDFHQANADAWKVSRNDAKTLLYATLYGAGPLKIGNGDKARGKALLASLKENAPAMFELKEKAWENAKKHKGHIHTMFGRRLYYPDLVPAKAVRHAKRLKQEKPYKYPEDEHRLAEGLEARAKRQVFNALLQGTAADIMKRLTIEAMPLIRQAQGALAAQVHDEILVYCPTPYAPWLKSELTKLFTRDDLLPCVQVTGDAKMGESWGDVH